MNVELLSRVLKLMTSIGILILLFVSTVLMPVQRYQQTRFFWVALLAGLPVAILLTVVGTALRDSTRKRKTVRMGLFMCGAWVLLALLSMPKS